MMQGRKGSRRWLVWSGWAIVVGMLILPLTITMGQRLNNNVTTRQRLNKQILPVSPSQSFFPRFSVSPSYHFSPYS